MKNVLFIINNLGGGGAEKVLVNILNNLDYDKYNVDLLLILEEGVYLDRINKNVNVKCIIPKNSSTFFHRLYRYCSYKIYEHYSKVSARFFIGKKYDVEIAFLEGPSTLFLSRSPNKASKKIAWVHVDLTEFRTMSFEKEKKMYENIDEIVCVSQQSKDKFIELYPEYNEKTRVIYNLINKDEILNLSQEKIKIKFNENTIVAIGRLTEQKRFDILIKAHKLLIDEGINNKLVILGEGHLRGVLEKLIKELNLQTSVFMPGFIKNPYPYIKNCTVYAMSSDYEGLPLVIAEAMTLGKAIVSTDCTGPTELLGNGEFGVLVERENEVELKNGIKELIMNKKLRHEYENKAIERSKVLNKDQVLNSINKLIVSQNEVLS